MARIHRGPSRFQGKERCHARLPDRARKPEGLRRGPGPRAGPDAALRQPRVAYHVRHRPLQEDQRLTGTPNRRLGPQGIGRCRPGQLQGAGRAGPVLAARNSSSSCRTLPLTTRCWWPNGSGWQWKNTFSRCGTDHHQSWSGPGIGSARRPGQAVRPGHVRGQAERPKPGVHGPRQASIFAPGRVPGTPPKKKRPFGRFLAFMHTGIRNSRRSAPAAGPPDRECPCSRF